MQQLIDAWGEIQTNSIDEQHELITNTKDEGTGFFPSLRLERA